MANAEPGAHGDGRPPGWGEFRDARRRFLETLERQTEMVMLERLWEAPAVDPDERRPRPLGA